jgi:predicted metal-binding membrane protein
MDLTSMGVCTPEGRPRAGDDIPPDVQVVPVAAAACAAPAGARRDRRFALLFLPIVALSGLAWFAVVRWGGTREMRRGLLTGGPALMTMNSGGGVDPASSMPGMAMPGMDMHGMDMHGMTTSGGGGHSMSMLGVSMLGKDPLSPGYAGLFLWMWAVMILAMMVPAMLPALRGFFRTETTVGCGAGARFLGGVLAVWLLTGTVMYVVLANLNAALPGRPRTAIVVGAIGALAAGLYQFSRSKERLLSHVRGPFCCGQGHWRAGLRHGRRCVASCGPYMATAALVGAMSVFWMAIFAVVMIAEQLLETMSGHGRLIARGSGAVVVVTALGLLLTPSPLPLVG